MEIFSRRNNDSKDFGRKRQGSTKWIELNHYGEQKLPETIVPKKEVKYKKISNGVLAQKRYTRRHGQNMKQYRTELQ